MRRSGMHSAGRRAGASVAALSLAIVVLAGCGSSPKEEVSSKVEVSFGGTAYPNVDLANTRHTGGPIDSSSVSQLKVAWRLPTARWPTYGFFSDSPVAANDVLYTQDLRSNVRAIDVASGKVLWVKKYEEQVLTGPNGVTVASGRVYGATPTAAFALDEKTGRQLWSVTLTHKRGETVDMAPGHHNGRVYVSTIPRSLPGAFIGGRVGVLWALNARTGAKLWHFDTVPKGLWGNRQLNSGGGLSYTPAFDGRGAMYFGVGHPGPSPGTKGAPWGSSRPGPNLYTDSIVKLNAKTGKLEWYHQLTPHDLYEWDPGPPMLVNSGNRRLVVAASKAGSAIALDAKTGKQVWRQLLGKHNGHDNDGLRAMRGDLAELNAQGNFYPFPGTLGGVPAPMSSNGSLVFAPVLDHRVGISDGAEVLGFSAYFEGELVALDAETGSVAWKHEFPSHYLPTYGPTTSVNDLVFVTTSEGTLYAFDQNDGRLVWQTKLPEGSNGGVTISGDTLVVPAAITSGGGRKPELVAYRLGG
jgi:outer membrane protein assembly factor BamB